MIGVKIIKVAKSKNGSSSAGTGFAGSSYNGVEYAMTADYAKEASKLKKEVQLWGQNFDGTADVNGSIFVPGDKDITIGNIRLEYDASNKALKITNTATGEMANLYTTGGITAYGAGSGTGGGGGLNGSVLTYANAISLTAVGNELSQIASAWSIKKLYDKIEAIDVSDQLTNYLQKTDAANLYQPKGHYLTSLGINVPTGLTVSGSPVTSSGIITIGMATGYSIPTTAKQGEWDAAYR